MSLPPAFVLKEGWLLKLGGQVKRWKKRWFKLNGESLLYQKGPDSSEPLNVLPLGGAEVQTLDEAIYGKKNVFGVTVKGRKRQYVIQGASDAEAQEWLRFILQVTEIAPEPDLKSPSGLSSLMPIPSANPSTDPEDLADSLASTNLASAEEGKEGERESTHSRNSTVGELPEFPEGDNERLERTGSVCTQIAKNEYEYSDSDSDNASALSLDSETEEEHETDTAMDARESELQHSQRPEPHNDFVSAQDEIKMVEDESVVRSGFLFKVGANVKSWKRRFFVLRGFRLQYYVSHDWQNEQMLGEVHLVGAIAHHVDDKLFDRTFMFSVEQQVAERRMYYFMAANEDDRMNWMQAIKEKHAFSQLAPSIKVFEIKMTMNPDEKALAAVSTGLKVDQISLKGKSKGIKGTVSKQKRRFVDSQFDLDLTYITDRIIAMGFPSHGAESMYRNSSTDVVNFFNTRHKDHYKVYNLCSERKYDHALFDGKVSWFPFDDHNVCAFQDIAYFCKDVAMFLAKHPKNVAAIHCKAGKGRTGLMISIFLLYCGEWNTAPEALSYYGFARTHDQKGVTIPSQKRWVNYFGDYMAMSKRGESLPPPSRWLVHQIRFSKKAPSFNGFMIQNHGTKWRSKAKKGEMKGIEDMAQSKAVEYTTCISAITKGVEVEFQEPVSCLMDIYMEFSKKSTMGSKQKVMSFWLHTSFLPPEEGGLATVKLVKKKHKEKSMNICEIDKATKFGNDFEVEIIFKRDPNQEGVKNFPY